MDIVSDISSNILREPSTDRHKPSGPWMGIGTQYPVPLPTSTAPYFRKEGTSSRSLLAFRHRSSDFQLHWQRCSHTPNPMVPPSPKPHSLQPSSAFLYQAAPLSVQHASSPLARSWLAPRSEFCISALAAKDTMTGYVRGVELN